MGCAASIEAVVTVLPVATTIGAIQAPDLAGAVKGSKPETGSEGVTSNGLKAPNSFEEGLQQLTEIRDGLASGQPNKHVSSLLEFMDKNKDLIRDIAFAVIPFPGAYVVSAAIAIGHAAAQAVFNSKNSCLLAGRMLKVVHALAQHHVELSRAERLDGIIATLKSTQEKVLDYVKEFSGKSCLKRVVSYTVDLDKFRKLDALIGEVLSDFGLELNLEIFSSLRELSTRLEFLDNDKVLREELEAFPGGADELVKPENAEKLRLFMAKLRPGDELIMAKIADNECLAEADRQRGPHKVIDHPLLRMLWREYRAAEIIPWENFWRMFPANLLSVPDNHKAELMDMLNSVGNQAAFELAVDKDGIVESLSALELDDSFKAVNYGSPALIDRVRLLLMQSHAKHPDLNRLPSSAGDLASSTASHAAVTRLVKLYREESNLSCPSVFVGRDAEVAAFAQQLQEGGQRRLASVVGGPGMGTSAFAKVVGMQLRKAFSGGAYYVDLASAKSKSDAIDKVLLAVNGGAESRGEDKLRATMVELQLRDRPVLVILDHCNGLEDEAVEALLAVMMQVVPQLSVITCAKPLYNVAGVQCLEPFELKKLAPELAVSLLSTLVPDKCGMPSLTAQQATAIAAKCEGNPTLLRLMGRRLAGLQAKPRQFAKAVTDEVDVALAQQQQKNTAEAALARAVSNRIMEAIRWLQASQRPLVLLLSLLPSAFTGDKAQKLLGVTEDAAQDLLDSAVDNGWVEDSNGVYQLQPLCKQVFRVMLQNNEFVPAGQVLAARQRLVSMTLANVMANTLLYKDCPRPAYEKLLKDSPDVAEVLRLPSTAPDVAVLCLGEVVSLLKLLRHVDVYDAAMVRSACDAWGHLCATANDSWGVAACMAVGALFVEPNDMAWTFALERIETAKTEFLAVPAASDEQRLTVALVRRAEGLILRETGNYEGSIAAFKAALDAASTAFDSSETGQMDRIINLAELTGTLDYVGITKEAEGSAYGAQAVQAAHLYLGKDASHPLLALCLTVNAYFLKMAASKAEEPQMSELYERCVEANQQALTMRLKAYGDDHPDVAISWQQKALPLGELRRYPDANLCNDESLRIRLKIWGADNLMVANTRHNIGDALVTQGGDGRAAVDAYREALRIRLKLMKASHGKVTKVKNALVALLRNQLRDQEAAEVESMVAAKL